MKLMFESSVRIVLLFTNGAFISNIKEICSVVARAAQSDHGNKKVYCSVSHRTFYCQYSYRVRLSILQRVESDTDEFMFSRKQVLPCTGILTRYN